MSSITDRLKATKLKKGLDSCKFHNLCFCEYLMPMYNRLKCTSILHSIISISVKSHTASTLTKQQLQQLFSHMKCYFQRSRHLDTVCATFMQHSPFMAIFLLLHQTSILRSTTDPSGCGRKPANLVKSYLEVEVDHLVCLDNISPAI